MPDDTVKLALETVNKNKQAIIFVASRASAEKTAEDISKHVKFNYPEFGETVLKAASTPTKQCKRLSKCVKKGIAFHHAGLMQKQKDLVEDEFRDGKIRIICATPTLAAGLSLPVFRVIIKTLKRFSGGWGMNWIPVLEYLQMAGRAGRPEYEQFGEAITIAKNDGDKEEIFQRYICGVPEDISSKLAVEPVLRTYLLSLISSGIINNEKSMRDFFYSSFWAHQFKDYNKLNLIMKRMLLLLEKWNFIKIVDKDGNEENKNVDAGLDGDFVIASNIVKGNSEKSFKATLIGKRVSQLYLDPLTARHLLDCLEKYDVSKGSEKNNFSLLQMISHTLEMRPLLRVKAKDENKVQEKLLEKYDDLLEEEPPEFDYEYNEFMSSIKTALYFEDWIDEKGEDFLLDKYDIRPGEIRVKNDIADWLLYAVSELIKIKDKDNELINDLVRLRIRVKKGVKEDLLKLIKLKGIGRARARKLVLNGLKDLGELKKVDITTLSQILGVALAVKVKEQLGEKVKEIPKGKRKGQLSLMKYHK